jgi:hypothetical protein
MPFDNPYHCPFGDIEVLMDARSRIADADRWLKNNYRDQDRQCLVAALSMASGSRNFEEPNHTELRISRTLAKQLRPKRGWSRFLIFVTAQFRLIEFNDHYRTQHKDVLALIDRTIEHLRNDAPVHAAV